MVGKVIGYHPHVPDGTYIVKYCGYETGQSWNSKKVIVNFGIVEGDHAGIPLIRYYNAKRLVDPVGADGDFDVGDRSYLVKEYRSLFPDIQSTSEIDLNRYRDKFIRVKVATIKKTGTHEELDESNQYSIIRKLLEIVHESYQ